MGNASEINRSRDSVRVERRSDLNESDLGEVYCKLFLHDSFQGRSVPYACTQVLPRRYYNLKKKKSLNFFLDFIREISIMNLLYNICFIFAYKTI